MYPDQMQQVSHVPMLPDCALPNQVNGNEMNIFVLPRDLEDAGEFVKSIVSLNKSIEFNHSQSSSATVAVAAEAKELPRTEMCSTLHMSFVETYFCFDFVCAVIKSKR